MSQNASAVICVSGIDVSAYLGNLVKYASTVFLIKLGNTNSKLDNVCWNDACADMCRGTSSRTQLGQIFRGCGFGEPKTLITGIVDFHARGLFNGSPHCCS